MGSEPAFKMHTRKSSLADCTLQWNIPMHAYGKLQLADAKRAGFHGIFIPRRLNRSSLENLDCKPRSGEMSVQNITHVPVYPAGFAGYITLATQKMTSHDQLQAWLNSDAPELVAAIAADIQRHVCELRSSGDSFYGYAALPGDYCTQPNPASLVVAFNRESDLAAEHSNEPYYRYSVDEWQNYVRDGFENTNSALESQLSEFKKLHTRAEDSYQLDKHEIAFIAKTNRAVLKALMELKTNRTFADGTYLIIWFSDSEDEIMNESARALNTAQIYEQYASEFHAGG